MKKTILISTLLVCFTTLFIISCSEEIIVKNNQSETAIVYGLLDQNDTIHYIKINRAFGGTTNALETAKIPDSSYFKSVEATIFEIFNKDTLRKWKLNDTVLNNKEDGAFFGPEQKLYYFLTAAKNPLIAKAGYEYYFIMNVNNNQFKVEGKTELIQNAKIGSPSSEGNAFSFASNDVNKFGYASTQINFQSGTSTQVNVSLSVEFEEFKNSNKQDKSFIWDVSTLTTNANSNNVITCDGQRFYNLLKSNCTVDNSITRRRFKSIEMVLTYGSEELRKYIELAKPSSSLSQTQPIYTNLKASNGMLVRGLFSSKTVIRVKKISWQQFGNFYYAALDTPSMKELCKGQITGSLLFCSDNPFDINQNYFCK